MSWFEFLSGILIGVLFTLSVVFTWPHLFRQRPEREEPYFPWVSRQHHDAVRDELADTRRAIGSEMGRILPWRRR